MIFKNILVALSAIHFFANAVNCQPDSPTSVPGIIISHQPEKSRQYIGSPSIALLPNGNYVVSHDLFGPNSSFQVAAITKIFHSKDKGKNWKKVSEIRGCFWSKLFVHKGALYIMGTDRQYGSFFIRKSDDEGATWTEPTTKGNGLLLSGEFHCAPTPVVEYGGRLWRAIETAHGPVREWGKRFGAMLISAPSDANLLQAKNWTSTNVIYYDATLLEGKLWGWLEGNAVVTPRGEIANMLRVQDTTTFKERSTIMQVTADGKKITFNPTTDFIDFPGGGTKFTIHFDSISKKYWTLINYIPEIVKTEYPTWHPGGIRNTIALSSSENLRDWKINGIVLHHIDATKHGFQYIDWAFNGNDIVFVSRTAYEDEYGGALKAHDANYLTFHQIKNFRNYVTPHYWKQLLK